MATHSWWRGDVSSAALAPASPGGIVPVPCPAATPVNGATRNASKTGMIGNRLLMDFPFFPPLDDPDGGFDSSDPHRTSGEAAAEEPSAGPPHPNHEHEEEEDPMGY